MGLRPPSLRVLLQARDRLQETAPQRRPWKMLSLSWQDCVLTDEQIVKLFGPGFVDLPNHPDQEAILRWHKANVPGYRVPDWVQLVRRLGFDPLVTDLAPFRGCEQPLDLNKKISGDYHQAFDLVLDNCLQHCANATQAMTNILNVVRPGGLVMHVNPLNQVNQGFWSLSPCLYHDFYLANGFKVLSHVGYYGGRPPEPYHDLPLDPVRRMKGIPEDSVQMFLAERLSAAPSVVWPLQGKFQLAPDSLTQPGVKGLRPEGGHFDAETGEVKEDGS